MRGRIVIAALVALALVGSVGAGRATAGLNIDFNLITQPQLVVVPGTPVAYAPAVPANYFFYNGQYYLFADGGWFVAGGYNGPWLALSPAYVPGALLSGPGPLLSRPSLAVAALAARTAAQVGPRLGPAVAGSRPRAAALATITAASETAMITAATGRATMATPQRPAKRPPLSPPEGAIEAPSATFLER